MMKHQKKKEKTMGPTNKEELKEHMQAVLLIYIPAKETCHRKNF